MVSLASTEKALGIMAPSAGGSLKRRRNDDSPTSSQTKKPCVAFDPNFDVHILTDENDKSIELVREEVRTAIDKRAAGSQAAYDELKGLFRELPPASSAPLSGLLQKYVVALTDYAPLLDHSCKGLVHAVIDCAWAARNDAFVRSYRIFLRSLLAVQPNYLSTVLQMLVDMFLNAPSTAARHLDDPPIQAVRLGSRIHDCLKFILRSNSMASASLAPILASTFPFIQDNAKTHVLYMRNILLISQYCPEIKREVLALVTDRLVRIDVQMQVDLEDLEDDLEERLLSDAVTGVAAEDDTSDIESVSSEESLDPEEEKRKLIRDLILKLDMGMDLQFAYYDSILEKGDRFEINDAFEGLLSQFKNIVLPTYRSRHTQFAIFHFSQTCPDRTARFARWCSHLAFDAGHPQLVRNSALAYLASFIARGAHVSGALVHEMFDVLCHRLETLRTTYAPGCKGPDLRRYSTYYAIAQALLYVFCFRYRDLIATPDGSTPTDEDIVYHDGDFSWHARTQEILRRNVFSPLNPLKICAPPIVAQFARVAHHLRFLYVFPLIETNKLVRLARSHMSGASGYLAGLGARETALSRKKGEDKFLLDAYFPFDPYLLPRSRRWLTGDYIEWKPVPGMPVEHEEDDESDSSSDREEEEDMEVEVNDDSTEVSL